MDPMDLFFIILTGGDPRRMRRQRPRNREHFHFQEQNQNQGQNVHRMNKYMMFVQLLPFIVLVLFSVVPYLFQSVIHFLISRDLIINSIEMKNFIKK